MHHTHQMDAICVTKQFWKEQTGNSMLFLKTSTHFLEDLASDQAVPLPWPLASALLFYLPHLLVAGDKVQISQTET